MTILAFVFGSARSASAYQDFCQSGDVAEKGEEQTCSSSTEAASIRPSILAICVDLTISTFLQHKLFGRL